MSEVILLAFPQSIGESLTKQLREGGHRARYVATADEAFQVLRESPVSVVLAQATVPASEAAVREKLLQFRPDCRVVFLSSFNETKLSGNLLEYGDNDFIVHGGELATFLSSEKAVDRPETSKRYQGLVKALDVLIALHEVDDPHFAGTSNRVGRLACAIADRMGLPQDVKEDLFVGTLLRDIGKAGVRNPAVLEPDELSEADRKHAEQHVEWSVRLLEHIDFDGKVLPVVRHHHERYDGKGYPDGLKGRQIPVAARVVSAAEAFVAMTSDRPHRPKRSVEDAIRELTGHAGTQFDPEIVEVLSDAVRDTAAQTVSVLIVEPDQELRRLLRMRLLNEGYKITTVERVDDETRNRIPEDPDLVLADASVDPERTFELFQQIRGSGDRVPFAIMTADDDQAVTMKALELGVDDIICKKRSLAELGARVRNIVIRETARKRAGADRKKDGLRGQLETIGMSELIQMLCIGKKTGRVTLRRGDEEGSFWIRDSKIVDARTGGAVGPAAFFDLMNWTDAEFQIQHGETSKQETMDGDAIALLMEHFRRVDESEKPDEDDDHLDELFPREVSA